jgi:hypothetical protein
MKPLSQESWSPGRDLNPGTPEHEAGVLTTRPRRSVILGGNKEHQRSNSNEGIYYLNQN